MSTSKIFFFILVCFSIKGKSQNSTFISEEIEINTFVDGTLLMPTTSKPPLAIIIADYGAKDRNGNEDFSKNNSLKQLAEQLTQNGIATFRYDKRIVKQIKKGKVDKNISFDDFITDAISTLTYFKNQNNFSCIYIIGHGQGSLVGMIAAQEGADGFISLAGSGKSIDLVITEQIEAMDPSLSEPTKKAFKNLKEGKSVLNYPPALSSIFSPDVQPFITNWMQYSPTQSLQNLNIPVLIINGTKDLQVHVNEAKLLSEANEKATLEIIDKMNHVFFIIEGDDLENSKSYNESYRKISGILVNHITSFIKN